MKTPEEKFIFDIYWILREIKGELLMSSGSIIQYNLKNASKNSHLNEDKQIKLLNKLAQWQIISFETANKEESTVIIKVSNKKFEELYKLIENAVKSKMPFDQIIQLSEAHGKHFWEDSIQSFDVWRTIAGRDLKKLDKPTKIEVFYDENKSILTINGKKCQLPIAKNEDYLCAAMFESVIGEPIDWSIIYEKITRTEPTDTKKDKKMLQDTIERLHNRIEKTTNYKIKLFSWQEKTIKRNY